MFLNWLFAVNCSQVMQSVTCTNEQEEVGFCCVMCLLPEMVKFKCFTRDGRKFNAEKNVIDGEMCLSEQSSYNICLSSHGTKNIVGQSFSCFLIICSSSFPYFHGSISLYFSVLTAWRSATQGRGYFSLSTINMCCPLT